MIPKETNPAQWVNNGRERGSLHEHQEAQMHYGMTFTPVRATVVNYVELTELRIVFTKGRA